jgi:hypothetical protein
VESQIGDVLEPRLRELFKTMLRAWMNTSPDNPEAIDGVAGGDVLLLQHPGLAGQDVSASMEDLRALEGQRLILLTATSKGDCRIEPHRYVLEMLQQKDAPPPIGFPSGHDQ